MCLIVKNIPTTKYAAFITVQYYSGMPLHDAVGVNVKKCRCLAYGLRGIAAAVVVVVIVYSSSSSSSGGGGKSALALVLPALQYSHIAPEVTYIHINKVYIYTYLPS